MKLLLDTHILLWWLENDTRLLPVQRAAIADPSNEAFVSAASIWETVLKGARNRLRVPGDFPQVVAREGFRLLPVAANHAWALRELPDLHRDPFDRILIAQAQVEGMTLVTQDEAIGRYPVSVL